MSLDALFGKPVPIPPVSVQVPETEDAPELDEIRDTMTAAEFQRAIKLIKMKRHRLDIIGANAGSGRTVTQESLLTGD